MCSLALAGALRFLNGATLRVPRAAVASSRWLHAQEIHPGDISLIEAAEEPHTGGAFDGGHELPLNFLDAEQLDTFSRARVVNFMKRFSQGKVTSGNDVFQVQEVSCHAGSVLYHCRVLLPFRSHSGELWAHGVACNGKDAEMLAAMHAEYIIDAFGYHIYTLPSMQRKHAEAARKAGRWAPMPDDGDRAQTQLCIPLPLRRIVNHDETEGGTWLLIDLRPNHYISPQHTLLSPCLFDTAAVLRVKSLFAEHGLSFAELCTSEADKPNDKNGKTYYTATVILPAELTTFGEIRAQGKALNREAAVTLACMHAELLLDAHSIALFPSDSGRQKQHALTAWSFGRPAPIPGEDHKNPSHVVPPLPLKEVAVKREDRVSCMSYEEDLVRRHRALTEQTCEFTETPVLDEGAVELLKGFLKREKFPRTDPFFIEEVQGFVKATVVLPIPDVFGVRGGVGIAMNAADAVILAAMHAIDVANLLGVHLVAEGTTRREWIAARHSRGESTPAEAQDPSLASPPGRRRIATQGGANGVSKSTNTGCSSSKSAASAAPALPQAPKRRVPKRAKIAVAAEEGEKKASQPAAEVDYLKARESVPKELWGLEPDSPDGYIMVSPNDPELRTQYEHALYSPRQIDSCAKVRIKGYLAALGRRAEEVFFIQRIEAEDNGGQAICRCALNLPVPRRFGDRIALGEAVDPKDAENLAAMHAELILDTLGIPLYTDGVLQRRHAELCLKNGRYAPVDASSNIPPSTASPPPLRREVIGSIHWENKTKRRAPIVISRANTTKTSVSAIPEEAEPVVAPKETRAYVFVAEKDLDLVSRPRVQYYLRRNGKPKLEADFRMELRGLGNVLHVAEFAVPVPASFGERIAHGSALTKRDAEVLCWMHAERIIDALGLCLFDNLPGLQKRHAERVKRLGRWAPLVGESTALPPDTPSPLPLTLGTAPEKPPYPSLPTNLLQEWDKYVGECRRYIEVNSMREENIFYEMEKIPRTGDALYDATVEEVESASVDVDAKGLLQRYCTAANVAYPVFWKSRTVGPVSRRVCLTTIEVPGHEHITATGVAVNKDASQRRAAMHALALLRRIEPDFHEFEKQVKSETTEKVAFIDPVSLLEGDASQARRPAKPNKKRLGSWDPVAKDFSYEGKVRIIELFTVCFGLQPPLVRHMNRREGILVHHSTTVEVTDEDGKLWVGEGQDAGPRFNEVAAYEDLFSRLSRGVPGFQALMDLIHNHFHLDPEHIANVSLSEAQKERIHRVLEDVPDVEEEEVAKPQEWGDNKGEAVGLLSRVAMDASERAQESQHLRDKLHEKLTNEEYLSKYAAQRQGLSIYGKREEILKAVESSQIVIVCGTTGCGKTTQVPQYILDHMTEKSEGGNCSIVITQPRRLSAVSIAQRVAAERLEGVGETCGYSIRLDSKPGRNINFCTSGILLRILHNTPLLNGINYLIIDEIHERDINSDFLLILLRQLLRRRKDLHVVLMSATLQAEQFGNYFDGAPIINVEGYVHPVKELYVEDLVPIAAEQKVMPPLLKEAASSLEREGCLSTSMDPATTAPPTIQPVNAKYGFMEATAEIDYVTIQFAIDHAVRSLDLTNSSILVFLPGWDEIHKAYEILERNTKFHIICLHSSVGAEEQMRCFLPAPEGKVKLILSTNIAESGVTIDDVAVVIDVGRAKEKSYVMQKGTTAVGRNEMGSISQLVTVYASRANCVQRRGRAGRTRPGICIRLYSKKHFETVHDFQTPEMLRTPLDALCLQILALDLGDPADFLQQAIEPPSSEQIEAAMMRLQELGATTSTRQLTPLGLRLSRLPVAPKVGKMVVMGAILKCLDSALTIAAVTDTDVFNSAREHREAVRLHKEDLSLNTQSDVIASVNAFNFWVVAHHEKTPAEVVYDLHERMLSVPQLLTVSKYKRQFFDIIMNSGFLGDGISSQRGNDSTRADIFVDRSEWSADALNVGLVKCVVASGLFPNVVMNRGKRLMRNKLVNRVAPSSASVVHRTSQEDITQPFFVYDEFVKLSETERLSVRGLTNVPLWTILLMGTSSMPVTYRDDLNLAVVDEWIMFRATFGTLELIRRFKRALNVCLGRKFLDPNDEKNNEKLEEMRCIIKELVSTPFKPNDLSEKVWEEKGTIIEPRTQPKKKEGPLPPAAMSAKEEATKAEAEAEAEATL
ncbi:putative RNA editing associated helicase 2,putative [Trypanosoma conorhini]|uniref:RNA helicase n=1 Tax=Trypanosoma conorhini TaxID=83891 RepID=A0A3R7MRE7_9TRYP|nr:putative RNA editing associated helicase 2,putative [Trypanosoma conorhini]RNF19444.1 putative RNA editing associated helicase 2,putative [Trypanosoma conorhini]